MASIKKINTRKYKITVSNGYRPDGRKISRAKTITVPVKKKAWLYNDIEFFRSTYPVGTPYRFRNTAITRAQVNDIVIQLNRQQSLFLGISQRSAHLLAHLHQAAAQLLCLHFAAKSTVKQYGACLGNLFKLAHSPADAGTGKTPLILRKSIPKFARRTAKRTTQGFLFLQQCFHIVNLVQKQLLDYLVRLSIQNPCQNCFWPPRKIPASQKFLPATC